MLKEAEVELVVTDLIDAWKKDRGKQLFANRPEPVEYYDGYLTFKQWRDRIAVHAVNGVKPIEMLSIKSPCQSDEELAYVLANYKQITLPVPQEFVNTIGRGMHSTNWSITYQEEASEFTSTDTTLQQYLEKDIATTPLRMSFESWWRFVLPSIKVNDSMAVVGIRPWKPERIVEDPDTGNLVIAGDELPEPIPFYYSCDQVLSPVDASYILVDTNERSWVDYGNKKMKIGFIFEIYDDQFIWRIVQVGKYIDNDFEIFIYFDHSLGFIPATRLKGSPIYMDGRIVWQSPLSLVTDILDEAILDNTNLRSIKASSTYPQKVMLGHVCRHSVNYNGVIHSCEGGYILNKGGKGYSKCEMCKGTGLEMRTSPLNTILIKPKDGLDTTEAIKPSEALSYQQPSTESAEFLRSEVIDSLTRSKEILHLKTTNQVIKGAEDMTATGMAIDEKAKNAFLSLPVDQIFEIGEFCIDCIGGMRYGKERYKVPTVQRPVNYDFNSEADYLANIAAAQQSGAPPVVIHGYLAKYLKSVYYDDKRVARIYDLMIATDRLLSLSQEDINMKLARNLVAPWEVVLHDSARNIIDNLMLADENFLESDLEDMKTRFITAAKALVPPQPTGARPLNADDILRNANNPGTPRG